MPGGVLLQKHRCRSSNDATGVVRDARNHFTSPRFASAPQHAAGQLGRNCPLSWQQTVDLGIDARRTLTTTITAVAAWRTRNDNGTLGICAPRPSGWPGASALSMPSSPPT